MSVHMSDGKMQTRFITFTFHANMKAVAFLVGGTIHPADSPLNPVSAVVNSRLPQSHRSPIIYLRTGHGEQWMNRWDCGTDKWTATPALHHTTGKLPSSPISWHFSTTDTLSVIHLSSMSLHDETAALNLSSCIFLAANNGNYLFMYD